MYQFRITQQEEGGYKFELKGIKMLVDDFIVQNDKHLFKNPAKAMAFFDFENSLYGVSNNQMSYNSAEEFHDAMFRQWNQLNKHRSK